jgi:dihydrolipoamide dehydrogenase
MEQFDVGIIGGGPGGYPAAIRAAQLGLSVALVEREELGGTCLNFGCIPTKLFIGAAELLHSVRHAAYLGIKAGGAELDFAALAAHKDRSIAQLRGGVGALLKRNGVRVIQGGAAFLNPGQISVARGDAEPVRLAARHFIIATGSTSFLPDSLPQHERIVESRKFLALKSLPERLLVLGGGYIGCELACMAARLGVAVVIVEMLDDILPGFDPDVRQELRKAMESTLGIRLLTGGALAGVTASASGVSASFRGETLNADYLLVATGRRPVTNGLGFEKIGVRVNARGYIEINPFGQTSVPTIYAVGDITGGTQLAHVATSQGIIAAENACGTPRRAYETVIPGVVFTSPEVGIVGLSEQEAKRRGIPVKVGRFPFAALGRSIVTGQHGGFAKWIAREHTDTLLGAAVVGPHATELIAEAAVAIRAKLKAHELEATIHAHPTFGEVWMEAAHAVHGAAIHAPPR